MGASQSRSAFRGVLWRPGGQPQALPGCGAASSAAHIRELSAGGVCNSGCRYQLHLLEHRCSRDLLVPEAAVYQPLKTEIFNHKMYFWTFSLLFLNSIC